MSEQSPEYIANPELPKYLTLSFKIESDVQLTKLLTERWEKISHTDAITERDALYKKIEQLEYDLEVAQRGITRQPLKLGRFYAALNKANIPDLPAGYENFEIEIKRIVEAEHGITATLTPNSEGGAT